MTDHFPHNQFGFVNSVATILSWNFFKVVNGRFGRLEESNPYQGFAPYINNLANRIVGWTYDNVRHEVFNIFFIVIDNQTQNFKILTSKKLASLTPYNSLLSNPWFFSG
jgi:hypothetical protein